MFKENKIKIKVLLIQAKQKEQDRFLIHPPYGLLYLASVLRKSNFDVKIYDANIKKHKSFSEFSKDICRIIEDWPADIVGIGGMVSSFKFVKEISAHIKQKFPDLPLVGGGLFVSASPKLAILHSSIDLGCIGEAEEVILELFEKVYNKEPLLGIPGLVLRKQGNEFYITGGQAYSGGRRPRNKQDLDWIPLPSYDLIDLRDYLPYQSFCRGLLRAHFKKNRIPLSGLNRISPYAMPIFAGRGCPFQCIFCFSTMDKKPIKHSVGYVLGHLDYLNKNYGLNHFQFLDENFNLHREWVMEFCRRITNEKREYYFTTGNRNRIGFFDPEMLKAMKQANFYDISVGVESLDDEMLQQMNRNTSSSKVIETLRLIKDAGIEQEHVRCLFGFPEDSKDSLYKSIKRGNKLGYKTLYALVIPLPGTGLYRYCLEKKLISDELGYHEEIYYKDGYRNMTKFKTLSEVSNIVKRANSYSEIDYSFRNKLYPQMLKGIFELLVIRTLIQLLEKLNLFNPINKLRYSLKTKLYAK